LLLLNPVLSNVSAYEEQEQTKNTSSVLFSVLGTNSILMAHVLGLSVLFQASVGSICTIEAGTYIVNDYGHKTRKGVDRNRAVG
jgi:hypothetical protein